MCRVSLMDAWVLVGQAVLNIIEHLFGLRSWPVHFWNKAKALSTALVSSGLVFKKRTLSYAKSRLEMPEAPFATFRGVIELAHISFLRLQDRASPTKRKRYGLRGHGTG